MQKTINRGLKTESKINTQKGRTNAIRERRNYEGDVTVEQKKQVVEEMTNTLVNVLGKKPEHIHIVIDKVEPENWGYAERLTTEYRKRNEPKIND